MLSILRVGCRSNARLAPPGPKMMRCEESSNPRLGSEFAKGREYPNKRTGVPAGWFWRIVPRRPRVLCKVSLKPTGRKITDQSNARTVFVLSKCISYEHQSLHQICYIEIAKKYLLYILYHVIKIRLWIKYIWWLTSLDINLYIYSPKCKYAED